MIKKILLLVGKKLGECLYKTFLFLMFHLFNFIASLFDWLTEIFMKLCTLNGILVDMENTNVHEKFEPKFTDEELDAMAGNLPANINRLQDIQKHYSVSYRQARRIKSALDNIKNSPDIRHKYA